jgi:hypothetical protein
LRWAPSFWPAADPDRGSERAVGTSVFPVSDRIRICAKPVPRENPSLSLHRAQVRISRRRFQRRTYLRQGSPFCPNIAVSPENDEVWITLKDVGKVQVYRAKPPFEQLALLDTGPITNHVNLVNNRDGKFAYVTIGGLNVMKVFRRGSTPQLYKPQSA